MKVIHHRIIEATREELQEVYIDQCWDSEYSTFEDYLDAVIAAGVKVPIEIEIKTGRKYE